MPLIDAVYGTTMTDALLGLAEHSPAGYGHEIEDEDEELGEW
jgi:hypothetical protein